MKELIPLIPFEFYVNDKDCRYRLEAIIFGGKGHANALVRADNEFVEISNIPKYHIAFPCFAPSVFSLVSVVQ